MVGLPLDPTGAPPETPVIGSRSVRSPCVFTQLFDLATPLLTRAECAVYVSLVDSYDFHGTLRASCTDAYQIYRISSASTHACDAQLSCSYSV